MSDDEPRKKDYHPDRWKCPDCGKVYVDPPTVIAGCSCGSERIQMREAPFFDGWEPPEWPADSDYSPDSYDIEGGIEDMQSRFDRVNRQ